MEVSNTCGNSDLAWLKFRAYKYCNKCHGRFLFFSTSMMVYNLRFIS